MRNVCCTGYYHRPRQLHRTESLHPLHLLWQLRRPGQGRRRSVLSDYRHAVTLNFLNKTALLLQICTWQSVCIHTDCPFLVWFTKRQIAPCFVNWQALRRWSTGSDRHKPRRDLCEGSLSWRLVHILKTDSVSGRHVCHITSQDLEP